MICDADEAHRLAADAAIATERIPVIQPNLLPGLARTDADPLVREIIERLCGDGTNVSLSAQEFWDGVSYDAYSFQLTRSRTEGCVLEQEAVVLTVGVHPGEPLRVGLRSRLPPTVTPIGACAAVSRYREEALVAGSGTSVRLVLITDHIGNTRTTRLVARRATPDGWKEQLLMEPAPQRLIDGGDGPVVSLSGTEDPWIVAHGNRTLEGGCRPVRGQVLWRWDRDHWDRSEGREALGRLADRGEWRLAGQAGWFLIVGQDIPGDQGMLQARTRRLQKRSKEPLHIRTSADFPKLNAGYLFVSPDPWSHEADARAAKKAWGRRTGAYVKRAWGAPDPCVDQKY